MHLAAVLKGHSGGIRRTRLAQPVLSMDIALQFELHIGIAGAPA